MNATQTRFMIEVGLDEVVRNELESLDGKLIEALRECHEHFNYWMHHQPTGLSAASFAEVTDHYASELNLVPTSEGWAAVKTFTHLMACMQLGIKPEYLHLEIACTTIRLCIGDVPVRYHAPIWDVIKELFPQKIDAHISDTIMDVLGKTEGFDPELARFIDEELHRNF